MARECGSVDIKPILQALSRIEREQAEQRQAIKLLGQGILEGGGNGNNGYQEAGFAGAGQIASNIGKILGMLASVVTIVTSIQRFLNGGKGQSQSSELEKLVRMIKDDTAKIGARTNNIQSQVDKMERKINDSLYVLNTIRPEIRQLDPIAKKVNDSLYVLNTIRPEIRQLDPIAKKVNDSLYVLNTVRPEIRDTYKKANDAAYAATQASSKVSEILNRIGEIKSEILKLSLAVAAGFTVTTKAILAAIAAEAAVSKAAMAAQTTAILAAIAANGVKDLLRGVLETVISSAINDALFRFFGAGSNGDAAILRAIESNSNRVIGEIIRSTRTITTQMSRNQDELIKFIIGVRGTITDSIDWARDYLFNRINDRVISAQNKILKGVDESAGRLASSIARPLTSISAGVGKIYSILGGDIWGAIDRPTQAETFPEAGIKGAGSIVYASGSNGRVRANNLIDLIYAALTPQYFRSGLQRIPTQLPVKIHLKNGEEETRQTITNLVDLQMWQFNQLDSALGAYPISIKYKDGSGQDKLIEITNIADAFTEMIGVMLAIDSDTDVLTELAIKSIGEDVQNKAQVSLAIDYLRAISDFLGFKADIGGKQMPIPINPKKNSLKGFLEKSTQQIQTVILQEPEDNDIISKLNQLIITTGMIRAVFSKRLEAGKVEGDAIKEDLDRRDSEWDQFVAFMNSMPSSLRDRGEPNSRVRDKTSLIQNQDPNPD